MNGEQVAAKLLTDRLEPLPVDAKAGREPNG
jgi:hypothetical protein